jgi:hypothetical protein
LSRFDATKWRISGHCFVKDQLSYTYGESSAGVSKDTTVSFNATRPGRKLFPIIVELRMTTVLFVFIAVRVLASGTFHEETNIGGGSYSEKVILN